MSLQQMLCTGARSFAEILKGRRETNAKQPENRTKASFCQEHNYARGRKRRDDGRLDNREPKVSGVRGGGEGIERE
ncbi:hypothetical protein JZ751_010080 [Albula glossodonta]|uniref:Uncharacterized protein n=1 Tax=Albula glossodonta TaxID=121402 RepID=A0A8T2N5G6_9TELE|nr:hypothetical protein JZ751_010080 [Albula glossodonta]